MIDPGSKINFITHQLAGQLQLESTLNKIFMKRVNKEYTKREVKMYCLGEEGAMKQVHWMEAVGVGNITEATQPFPPLPQWGTGSGMLDHIPAFKTQTQTQVGRFIPARHNTLLPRLKDGSREQEGRE